MIVIISRCSHAVITLIQPYFLFDTILIQPFLNLNNPGCQQYLISLLADGVIVAIYNPSPTHPPRPSLPSYTLISEDKKLQHSILPFIQSCQLIFKFKLNISPTINALMAFCWMSRCDPCWCLLAIMSIIWRLFEPLLCMNEKSVIDIRFWE